MSKRQRQEFLPAGETTTIFQRGRMWYVNYQFNGRQVRRSLNTANKKEAILRAQRIEADIGRGSVVETIQVASMADVINAFLAAAVAEDRAPKTLVKYRYVTQQIQTLADERRHTRISQLNSQFADAYRLQLKHAGRAPKTIYNSLVILRSVTLFAYRRKMSDIDPLVGYKLRKPKPTPQPCWTPEEADAIVAAAPVAYRPYFLFLRETGCRAGEGKFLTWDDVDLKRRMIHIRPKEGWKPKTGDRRMVPLTEPLMELFQSMPQRGRWVFTAPMTSQHPRPDRQISERRALLMLKRLLTKQKLNGHLHTFRHTFISQALMAGVPEPVVRQWVGHVDPQIIRLYTHVSDAVSQSFVQRLSVREQKSSDDAACNADSRLQGSRRPGGPAVNGSSVVQHSFQHSEGVRRS